MSFVSLKLFLFDTMVLLLVTALFKLVSEGDEERMNLSNLRFIGPNVSISSYICSIS